jgi:hypothetical protein
MQTSSPTAGYERADTPTAPAYVGSGNGSSPPEQFTAGDTANPGTSIEPGEPAILRSVATGMYCRLAALPGTSPVQTGVLCDQHTAAAAAATPLQYTGSGLATSDGIPLVATSAGGPLVLANTTTTAPGPDDDNLAFAHAGAPLPVGVPLNLLSPGACRVSSLTAATNCPITGKGDTLPGRFILSRPDAGTGHIQPGEAMLVKSEQTGKFCRVALIGAQQQVLCDQGTAATATPLTYLGTAGFAYNGQPFVNPGGGVPVYFGPANSSSTTPATFAAPPLLTNTLLHIETGKGFMRIDNLTSYAYSSAGDGTSAAEHFNVADPADPTATKLVESGQPAVLKSATTGMYCRLTQYP